VFRQANAFYPTNQISIRLMLERDERMHLPLDHTKVASSDEFFISALYIGES
jgi:hypothetical protein